ncbi:MAG: sigma-70 family RNA polymerase sigma factor [Phycisphaeraceae bacterium]|nr:sigma-70 family RNA polymerase sigma factor [Phycisphaeraceae bacterium]
MSDAERQDVTLILQEIAAGDSAAAAHLLPIVYEELRSLARAHLASERAGHTLQPTALVHEAYLRLVGPAPDDARSFNGRQHFFATAATAMRRILVDHARERNALKRGGGRRVELTDNDAVAVGDDLDLIGLDDALRKLESIDERRARVVTLRYFGGLTVEQTSAALGVSPATVKNDWAFARAWLLREMAGA